MLALVPDQHRHWGFGVSEYKENDQWDLTGVYSVRGNRFGSSNIKFYLQLSRKPFYFMINVATPIIA